MSNITDTSAVPPESTAEKVKVAAFSTGKAIGIMMLAGIPLQVLYLIAGAVPALETAITAVQVALAIVVLVVADSLIPLWLKEKIPVVRFGASRRAETYAKWYAWYSL